MKSDILNGREIIFEFFPMGQFVKVTAMDVTTLTEVSIQGPATTSKDVLKYNALKRLDYVLKKKGIV